MVLVLKPQVNSLFLKLRSKIGTKRLSKIFNEVKAILKDKGYMNEVFTFIDVSYLIAKKKDKLTKLNNNNLSKFGAKSKNKFWYGFKKHISIDMQSGLINKVALTLVNITDAKGLKYVCPSSGEVYVDKGYGINKAILMLLKKGCYLLAILKKIICRIKINQETSLSQKCVVHMSEYILSN